MKSRRVFLKMLFGLGAVILPWTGLPGKIRLATAPMMKQPKTKLFLVPAEAQTLEEYFQSESLNRTAWDDIQTLASPDMEGRRAGTRGEGLASQYISRELSLLGLEPMGEMGKSYTQAFTIPEVREVFSGSRLTFSVGDPNRLRAPSLNVLGGISGESEETILISAHYDHLGIFQGHLYPGASDNASGVGSVLDVIRRLVEEKSTPEKSLLFAFWSGEEMGFLGSRAFVSNPTVPLENIKAVINVDTVGTGPVGDFGLWADSNNDLAMTTIQEAASEAGAHAALVNSNGHSSDHITFARLGIPAVTILAREWLKNNHSPQDTIRNIVVEQVQLASEIVYRAIKKLAF